MDIFLLTPLVRINIKFLYLFYSNTDHEMHIYSRHMTREQRREIVELFIKHQIFVRLRMYTALESNEEEEKLLMALYEPGELLLR